jgi:tRNA 2-selenouridine synthase
MIPVFSRFGPQALAPFDTVIDVRSPSEFAEDHVPGAINLPVLDDAERALVGTVYKQESRFLARRIGAAKVARNIATHLDGVLQDQPPGWRPLVYCWRGGMRSGAMATILTQVGWHTHVVEGGYRTWRRHVTASLYGRPLELQLVVLDGNTGTGKTEVLAKVAARGGQVIDLEGLAGHRGSLFGHFAGQAQPSQKLFESRLLAVIEGLDPGRPVLVEAESSRIGVLALPPPFWAAMQGAPMLEVGAEIGVRAQYLTRTYADIVADRERLAQVIGTLRRLVSKETLERFQALAAQGDDAGLARALMEAHYDAAYARHRERMARPVLARLDGGGLAAGDLDRVAGEVLEFMGDVVCSGAVDGLMSAR